MSWKQAADGQYQLTVGGFLHYGGKAMPKTWTHWLHGLLGAAVGGVATGLVGTIVKPEAFNLTQWRSTLALVAAAGVVNAAAYLRKSPIPDTTEENQ